MYVRFSDGESISTEVTWGHAVKQGSEISQPDRPELEGVPWFSVIRLFPTTGLQNLIHPFDTKEEAEEYLRPLDEATGLIKPKDIKPVSMEEAWE